MAIKIFGLTILPTKQLNALKEAAGTEADRVVAALKQTEIGDAVVDSIKAIDNQALTGQQKFEIVVAEVAPIILRYVQNGGVKAAIGDVEDLGRQLVQSVYNSVKSKGFGKIVSGLVKLLGL
jgi:hypothetical protein